MSKSNDFARDLNEQPPAVRLGETDLQLHGVQVPPEPLSPAPRVEAPEIEIPPAPAPAKKNKVPLLLLPLLAIGALAYLATARRASTSQPITGAALSTSATPRGATPRGATLRGATASANKAKLKALWNKGAALKRRGDFAGARRVWQQGLKIEPGNRGFQQSIARLPSGSKRNAHRKNHRTHR